MRLNTNIVVVYMGMLFAALGGSFPACDQEPRSAATAYGQILTLLPYEANRGWIQDEHNSDMEGRKTSEEFRIVGSAQGTKLKRRSSAGLIDAITPQLS